MLLKCQFKEVIDALEGGPDLLVDEQVPWPSMSEPAWGGVTTRETLLR